jgi:hypothetical protein
VHLVAGDTTYNGTVGPYRRYHFLLEGQTALDVEPSATNRWPESTTIVDVADGRLTLTCGANNALNSLVFVEITPVGEPSNHAPTVTLTSPAPGSAFEPDASIQLAATASDDDGDIARVEFYANGEKLGEDAGAPFEYLWRPVDAGDYDLSAIAIDDNGATGSSAVTQVSVTNPAGSMAIAINFQPASAAVPGGYWADSGAAFADRGNGYSYGWNVDTSANTRDRNNAASPDQAYDTLNFQSAGTEKWEIALPNGNYRVRLVAGDTLYNGTVGPYRRYNFQLEGETVIDVVPSAANPWPETTVTISVQDGRLTLKSGTNAVLNSLTFVEIESI